MRSASPYLLLVAVGAAVTIIGLLADSTAFLGSLLGVWVSVAVVLVFESLLRPQIQMDVEEPPVLLGGRLFLRIIVRNPKMPFPLNLYFDRRPALFTRAWISFFHADDAPLFGQRRMRGRWAGTPEPRSVKISDPANPTGPPIGILWDPSGTQDAVDIGPGDSTALDLIMRPADDDTDECMGWYNDVIGRPIGPGDDKMFSFPKGTYRALVKVASGGRVTMAYFGIANPGSQSHTHLVKISGRIPKQVARHAEAAQ